MSNTDYSTTDIGLAAALVTTGEKLLHITPGNAGRYLFVFQQHGELLEKESLYFNNSLMTNARAMFDNLRMIKTRMYALQNK